MDKPNEMLLNEMISYYKSSMINRSNLYTNETIDAESLIQLVNEMDSLLDIITNFVMINIKEDNEIKNIQEEGKQKDKLYWLNFISKEKEDLQHVLMEIRSFKGNTK
ncbi:MAG: hypothetical protein IJ509_03375 [Bacilli bacterium]|nr:hypothetical protein [Bacilli bacterium]